MREFYICIILTCARVVMGEHDHHKSADKTDGNMMALISIGWDALCKMVQDDSVFAWGFRYNINSKASIYKTNSIAGTTPPHSTNIRLFILSDQWSIERFSLH